MALRAMEWKRGRPWWGWLTAWRGWRIVVDNLTIYEGETLPRGYGVAWRDLAMDRVVVMPIPLNVVVGLIRRAWEALRFHTAGASRLDIIRHEARIRGYNAAVNAERGAREGATRRAYDDGFRDGSEDVLDKLALHARGEWP